MGAVKCGVIGCGNISDVYFKAGTLFESIEIIACADVVKERGRAKGKQHNIPKILAPDRLLSDPDVQVVIILTPPDSHGDLAVAALEAGKHVYTEKPLSVTRELATRVIARAMGRELRAGCAPDTFMGAGIQTCRKLVDDGWIGEPVGATAFMMNHGHEHWHPDPSFFYQPGGGPMFDMGPYYLTALCTMLGPVRRVTGSARISIPERMITSDPKRGESIRVTTPTHISGVIDFSSGAIANLATSFDVWSHQVPHMEIYGTEGTLSVPDPNTFGGPVRVRRGRDGEWAEVPLTHSYSGNSRGLGVADMAYAIQSGRPHRASAEMAYHVLDVMQAFLDASDTGRHVEIQTHCVRPEPLPMGLREGTLDA